MENVIKVARQLGEEIQKNERFKAFQEAKAANESDVELNKEIEELNKIQEDYQAESEKETPDEETMKEFDTIFRDAYMKVMTNENMIAYESSRAEIDGMMNHVMQLLSLVVNGADPKTVEVPEQEENCASGSDCSGCQSGC